MQIKNPILTFTRLSSKMPVGVGLKIGLVAVFVVVAVPVSFVVLRAESVAKALASLANWSWAWFVPALILRFWIGTDSEKSRTVDGGGFSSGTGVFSMSVKVPDGISKGDPESAHFVFLLWLTAYPFGYFYFRTLLQAKSLSVTGLQNFDRTLLFLLVPIGGIATIGWLITVVRNSTSRTSEITTIVWRIIVGLGALNLLMHFVYYTGIITWLFKK